MLRANITIRAIKPDGEVFDFCEYYYNTENWDEGYFKEEVERDKDGIALWSCNQSGEDLDYVSVLSIEYEDIPTSIREGVY